MDLHRLVATLAITAGWISFNILILYLYFRMSGKGLIERGVWRDGEWLKLGRQLSADNKQGQRTPVADRRVSTSSTLPSQDISVEEVAPESDESDASKEAHVLFVIYVQPSLTINKKIQTCLQKWEAHYDSAIQMYSVPGATPQNPLRLVNAYPPGGMPALESFQQADNLLGGVSVILKKPKRRRGFDKVQLEKLITLSQELAALGGEIFDAQRQVATSETLYALQHQ